ncbi:MAG: TetR/AcrR family transcriptional regulator [Candidatus Sericytochromatia bacterium]
MPGDWLAASRSEVAADRILDAAAALFAERDAATVGMHEIARAAGCSRATLYRYFENREALHTAFVNREAYRLFGELSDRIKDAEDPAERLVAGVTAALSAVRSSPPLASWFAASGPPIGGEIAEQSDVISALSAAFVNSLSHDDAAVVERRARWLVRVITSLLILPGRNQDDEKQMLREFVVPTLVPTSVRGRV